MKKFFLSIILAIFSLNIASANIEDSLNYYKQKVEKTENWKNLIKNLEEKISKIDKVNLKKIYDVLEKNIDKIPADKMDLAKYLKIKIDFLLNGKEKSERNYLLQGFDFKQDPNKESIFDEIENYLPKDFYTKELLKTLKLDKKIIKINFWESSWYKWILWTEINWFIFVNTKNIENYLNENIEEKELFTKETINNEVMHNFLNKIWFTLDKNIDLDFFDILEEKNSKINIRNAHEFLSDYSTLSEEKTSKETFLVYINHWVSDLIWNKEHHYGYKYKSSYYGKLIKKIIWEKKYKEFLSQSKTYKEISEKIFIEFENKKFFYKWNEVSGSEYFKKIYLEQWEELMKKIYELKKERN